MTETKKKYVITVSRISSFQVEAYSRDHAEELAQEALESENGHVEVSLEEGDSGWEVTDVEERD